MELYLQFGARMMSISEGLVKDWNGGAVIISPRDLNPKNWLSFSKKIKKTSGSVLFDPQHYSPRADYQSLISNAYWPQNYETEGFNETGRLDMLQALVEINTNLQTSYFILPGEYTEEVNEQWLTSLDSTLTTAHQLTDQPLLMTVCMSAQAARSQEQLNLLMTRVEKWTNAAGFYLVMESPGSVYLSNDPVWLSQVLNLVAGLKRLRKFVILGCCNHQQLIMAIAGADAIASGTFNNVRTFSRDKYKRSYGEDFVPNREGPLWYYYCPQALSEYTLRFLDLGVTAGLKAELFPNPSTSYALPLFAVSQPSSSGWAQTLSFSHYLTALRSQARLITSDSFDQTVMNYQTLLTEAETVLKLFQDKGIFAARERNFLEVLDANRAAVINLVTTQGPLLRRHWLSLVPSSQLNLNE